MSGFISNDKYIAEDYKVEDLFGHEQYAKNFYHEVISSPPITLFGIVGPYGVGKSVMLEEVKKLTLDNDKWIHIDAWKYPDRRDLWEGFVLEFARQLGPKVLKKVEQRLEGSDGGKSTLIETAGDLAYYFLPSPSKPLLNGLKKSLKYFVSTSPAIRIYQIQAILIELIEKSEAKTIFIVIEDADRSGQAGIFFIETLNQYVKNLPIGNNLKILVPISKDMYDDKVLQQAFIKCLDEISFFESDSLDVKRFIKNIFVKNILKDEISISHMESLLNFMLSGEFTIRKMKMILRKCNTIFKARKMEGHEPDARLVIMFEIMKHMAPPNHQHGSWFNFIKRNGNIGPDGFAANLFAAVVLNITYNDVSNTPASLQPIENYRKIFHFVNQEIVNESSGTCIPFEVDNAQNAPARFCISDYYLLN